MILYLKSSTVQINTTLCNRYKRKIEGLDIVHTKVENHQTRQSYPAGYNLVSKTYPIDNNGYAYQYDANDKGNIFFPGDFDGDGNQDYVLLLAKARPYNYIYPCGNFYEFACKAFFSSPATSEANLEIVNFGVGSNPYGNDYFAKTVNEADYINVLDFDGDGKMELLVIKGQTSYVLSISRVSPASGFSFAASIIYTTTLINKDALLFPGDFNGDRKADLLIRNSNGVWNILYSTGNQFVSESFNFNQTVAFSNGRIDDNHKILIGDFNGDGKSDILHGYNYWFNGNTLKSKLSLYYSRSVVSAPVSAFYYEQYDYTQLGLSAAIVGDFNGDGRADFMTNLGTGAGAPVQFVYIKPLGQERLLQKVTTGHNVTTAFEYKLLTDKSDPYPYFYNRETSLDDPTNQNPFNLVQLPMYAVSAFKVPDGVSGQNTTTYKYKDAIINRAGKGFMGFKKVMTSNNISGYTVTTENEINTQFAIPFQKKETMLLASTNQILTEAETDISFVDLTVSGMYKRSFQKVNKITSVDYLNSSKATETTNAYDSYGNITNSTVKTGYISGGGLNAIETGTVSTTFLAYNTPVPSLPTSVTTTNVRQGSISFSTIKTFGYTAYNQVYSQTVFSGLPNAVTETFTYNTLGNLVTQTKSASNLPSVINTFTHDSKGRYIIQKEVATGTSIAQTETMVMNSKWGFPMLSQVQTA